MEIQKKAVQARHPRLVCQVAYLLTHLLTYSLTHLLTYSLSQSKRAFQVFEEREQIVRDNLEASASVKNTLKLHSNKVKNVLAATRAFGAAVNKPSK